MSWLWSDAFFFAVVLQTAPLLLAGTGGLFSQQANVLNIALDGMMLTGAFTAITVGAETHSTGVATLAACGAALAVALLFGFVTLYLGADLLVAGIGLTTLTGGLTVLLLSTIYHDEGSYHPPNFPHLWKLHLGVLRHLPVLGPAFEGQSVLVVLAVVLVPAAHLVINRTRFGLRIRAVGQEEEAAVAAGLATRRLKLATIAISGVLCGAAGAQLAMATLGQFVIGMTAGRGFIALAAIFVGGTRPIATAGACLVFGFAAAVADQLQLQHLPSDLVLMLPYVVTLVVLVARPLWRIGRERLVRTNQPGRSQFAIEPAVEVSPGPVRAGHDGEPAITGREGVRGPRSRR